jgi:hypothetical protein
MSVDLAKFLVAARENAELKATQVDAVQKKMLALAIDPLLPAMSLDSARAIYQSPNGAFIEVALRKMTLTQLRKASRSWNPHRAKIGIEVGMADLQAELKDLLDGAPPAPRQARAQPSRRARTS